METVEIANNFLRYLKFPDPNYHNKENYFFFSMNMTLVVFFFSPNVKIFSPYEILRLIFDRCELALMSNLSSHKLPEFTAAESKLVKTHAEQHVHRGQKETM